jgi:hypothetical protein
VRHRFRHSYRPSQGTESKASVRLRGGEIMVMDSGLKTGERPDGLKTGERPDGLKTGERPDGLKTGERPDGALA